MEKKAIGINLRSGHLVKRIWFEVSDSIDYEEKLTYLGKEINKIESNIEWKEFLHSVEKMFGEYGFYRIAK